MSKSSSLFQPIELPALGDERGHLGVLEGMKTIPFEVKRVYYLTDTKEGVSRGFHAHRELEQVAICVSGKCRMIYDDGAKKEELWMDSPYVALPIPPMIWHEMHDFSADCVLLVLASDYYLESDYIRDYEEFLKLSSS